MTIWSPSGSKKWFPSKIGQFLQSIGFPIHFATPPLAFATIHFQPSWLKTQMSPFWKLEMQGNNILVNERFSFSDPGPPPIPLTARNHHFCIFYCINYAYYALSIKNSWHANIDKWSETFCTIIIWSIRLIEPTKLGTTAKNLNLSCSFLHELC